MSRHSFRVIDGAPCPKNIAPYIAIVLQDSGATVNSIYRGTDAEWILHRHGRASQRELYQQFVEGRGAPANQPGFSTHELKSDGVAYPHVPRGHDLPWWGQGFDVNDVMVPRVMAAASRHGWQLFRPYPGGAEFHHLNFRRRPRPGPRTWLRILRLRARLPRS